MKGWAAHSPPVPLPLPPPPTGSEPEAPPTGTPLAPPELVPPSALPPDPSPTPLPPPPALHASATERVTRLDTDLRAARPAPKEPSITPVYSTEGIVSETVARSLSRRPFLLQKCE